MDAALLLMPSAVLMKGVVSLDTIVIRMEHAVDVAW